MQKFVYTISFLSISINCLQHFNFAGALPLSGQFSNSTLHKFQGYEFFCNQLNERGGFSLLHNGGIPYIDNQAQEFKYFFNCTFLDDQSNLTTHLNLYKQFINDPGVDFLVAGHFRFIVQLITTVMQQTNKIIIVCCVAREDIYEKNLEKVFGMTTSSKRLTDDLIKSVALNKIKNVVFYYENNHPFTSQVCSSAIEQAKDRRLQISSDQSFNSSILTQQQIQNQVQDLVRRAKANYSEAIIACVFQAGISEYLTVEVAKQKLPLKVFFMTSMPATQAYREKVGNLSEYVLSAGAWHRGIRYKDPFFGNNSNFVNTYEKTFGESPVLFSALSTAAMETYLEGIKSAFIQCDISKTYGSVEKLLYGNNTVKCRDKYVNGYKQIQDAIFKINVEMFLGKIYFNQFRQNAAPQATTQIMQSGGKLDDFCVLPVKNAEAKLIMPQPNRYPEQCEAGYVQGGDEQFGECAACPAGRRRCATCPQTSCEYCSKSEYNIMTGQSECLKCPPNTEAVVNGATTIKQCQCKPDFYNPYYQVGVGCTECPVGGICPGHNNPISAQNGYWISKNLPQQLYQCNPKNICVQGDCKKGYTGLVCSWCEQGFYKALGQCKTCPSKQTMYMYILGVLLFWWIISSVLARYLDSFAVILNWLQLVSVVALFAVNWQPSIFAVLSVTALFSFQVDVVQLSCLNQDWSFTHSFVAQLILPIIAGLFSALTYFCSYVYYRFWSGSQVVGKCVSFFVMLPRSQRELQSAFNVSVASFLLFLNGSILAIAKSCFNSFSCVKIGGEMVVKGSYDIKCAGNQYHVIRILGVVGLCVYMIPYLFYLVFVSIQLKRGKRFHEQSRLQRLGWFYSKYEVEWYWYELTHILHRIVFVGIFFFVRSPMMQCVYAILITIALLLLQVYSRPYIDVVLDILQIFLLIALMVIIFSGLIFYNPLISEQTRRLVEVFVSVILGLLVCVFVAFLFRDILGILVRTWATWKIKKASGLVCVEDDVAQLMHVFELRYFILWLFQSSEQEQQEMFLLSQQMADYVSNESDTSYLSVTKAGRWWRELCERFPEVIDFLAVVDKDNKKNFINFVEVLYKDFYHHKGKGNIHRMINWQDRAAVSQWLTLTTSANRRLFNTVTLLVFKLTRGQHVANELKLRMASNGKLIQNGSKQVALFTSTNQKKSESEQSPHQAHFKQTISTKLTQQCTNYENQISMEFLLQNVGSTSSQTQHRRHSSNSGDLSQKSIRLWERPFN